MRLIDADALKKAIFKHLCVKSEKNLLPTEKNIFNLIDKQPKVDLLEELQKWNFFTFREPTDEEKESYGNVDRFVENCPECGEEVLVWNGKGVYQDTFLDDGDVVYFENSINDIQPGWAWMPLPKPPKDGEQG